MSVIHVDFTQKRTQTSDQVSLIEKTYQLFIDDSANYSNLSREQRFELIQKIKRSSYAGPYYGGGSSLPFKSERFSGFDYILPVQTILPRTIDGVMHIGGEIFKGGIDPLIWIDHRFGLTKTLLKDNKNNRLQVHTKSDLISHDDYMTILNPKKCFINIYCHSLDFKVNSSLEPIDPSISRRLSAINKLAENGFEVRLVYGLLQGEGKSDEIKRKQTRDVSLLLDDEQTLLNKKVKVYLHDFNISKENMLLCNNAFAG